MTDRLTYSTREAAEALGISTSKVYALIRRGELRSIRVDGRRLIARAWLREFLGLPAEETVAASPTPVLRPEPDEVRYLVVVRRLREGEPADDRRRW
jgi:excisionase family DNA binding protein